MDAKEAESWQSDGMSRNRDLLQGLSMQAQPGGPSGGLHIQTGDMKKKSGPPSPAQRIKAHRGGVPETPGEERAGFVFAPLPDDDSALPNEALASPGDSPAAPRQYGGPAARRLTHGRGQGEMRPQGGSGNVAQTPLPMHLFEEGAPYIRSVQNQCDMPGYEFKRGEHGIGYYRTTAGAVAAPHLKPAAGAASGRSMAIRGKNQNMGSGAADVFGMAQGNAWAGANPAPARCAPDGKRKPDAGSKASRYAPTSLW